jgi:hypothetical protein
VGKRQDKVRECLRRAQDELALVRIDRGEDVDRMDGYVVAVGAEWLLLAVLDDAIVLDGHAALRVEDVRRVRSRSTSDMVQQALTVREHWPPTPPAVQVDLDSTRGLLTSLMTQPLVTVHPENEDADICFVGAPAGLGDRSLRLLEVTPRAVWNSRPTKYRLDDITRVEIGGRYEQALLSVAGPAPDVE